MTHPLFRPQVVAERQSQWLGTVLLAPRLSYLLFTAFAALATSAVLALLFFGSYTKKARINGWLVPQQGLMRIFTTQAGVITQLRVQEGAEVRKGDPLVTISTELQSAAFGATQTEIAHRLADRRDSLIEDRKVQRRLDKQQREALSDRLIALQSEQKLLKQEIDLQQNRLKLAKENISRQRQLHDQGHISDQQLMELEENEIDQMLRLRSLEREQVTTKRERVTLQGELKDLPLTSQTQVATIDRNIAALEQELAETEVRRQRVITAPQDGTVTSIQAEPGGNANISAPLLSIIPAGSQLEARLFSPSRAIGFVKPGQRVLLRYQAYPYQKFGHYEGEVAHVSRSAESPNQLSPQLSGLTSLYAANEPIYRITVNLTQQTVTAYGKPLPLQPGMQLEADVVIETRKLYEWVLDPLYTLTGKWNK